MCDKYQEAIACYKSAIESLQGLAEFAERAAPSFFNKGNAYFFLKDYQKAAEAYTNALNGNPNNKDYHFNSANACIEIKNFKSAIFHLKSVIQFDENHTYPNTEAALMTLAGVYKDQMNDDKRAKKVYKKLRELFPNNSEAKKALSK